MIAVPDTGMRARVVTAGVLIPLVIAGVLWLPAVWLLAGFALFVVLAAWEWSELCGYRSVAARLAYVSLTVLLLLLTGLVPLAWLLWASAAWWLAALLLVASYPAVPQGKAAWSLMGFLVLVPCWAALASLAQAGPESRVAIIVLLGLVWAADTGAFLTGRRWGSRKLSRVSPGKTWEGLAGGIAAALGVAVVGGWLLGLAWQEWAVFLLISLTAVLASVVGDLLESLLKRVAGRKDSGTLLPGHGGLLDRVDSLTAAIPVFVLGLTLLRSGA